MKTELTIVKLNGQKVCNFGVNMVFLASKPEYERKEERGKRRAKGRGHGVLVLLTLLPCMVFL